MFANATAADFATLKSIQSLSIKRNQWNKKLFADRNKPNLAEVIKRDLANAKSVLKLDDPLKELRQFDAINEQRNAYAARLMAGGVPPGSLGSINRLYQELMTAYGVKGGSFPFLISRIIVDTNQARMRSVLGKLASDGVDVCKELQAHPHYLIAKLIVLVRLRNLLAHDTSSPPPSSSSEDEADSESAELQQQLSELGSEIDNLAATIASSTSAAVRSALEQQLVVFRKKRDKAADALTARQRFLAAEDASAKIAGRELA